MLKTLLPALEPERGGLLISDEGLRLLVQGPEPAGPSVGIGDW